MDLLLKTFLAAKDDRYEIIYQGFIDRSIEIPSSSKKLYLRCLTHVSKDVIRSIEFLDKIEAYEEDYQAVLEACREKHDIPHALYTYQKLKQKFVDASIHSTNILLTTFALSKDSRILGLFQMFKKFGNIETYHAILRYYALTGDLNKSKDIINEMRDRGIKTTVVTYNIMTGSFFRNKWKKTMEQKMKK
jgi:pentatricopeptide repeat protein